jgi:uncharacterized membrane protein YphA (DoxX/SURF4 family)
VDFTAAAVVDVRDTPIPLVLAAQVVEEQVVPLMLFLGLLTRVVEVVEQLVEIHIFLAVAAVVVQGYS